MPSRRRLYSFASCFLIAGLIPASSLWSQANIPQWSPYRPAPRPLQAVAPLAMVHPSPNPQWVLVRNRDLSTGLPPYALADASGKLVRYVEPSPGIPIEQYLGQTVEVRHDTGRVVLSSQLVAIAPQAPASATGVALAEYRAPRNDVQSDFARSNRPLGQAEMMAQRLLGDHEEVHDRGPMQSLFEWAGGKHLGRFISVGEPRLEEDYHAARQLPSAGAVPHATASAPMTPPIRW